MNNTLAVLALIILIGFGGYWLYTNDSTETSTNGDTTALEIKGENVSYFEAANGYFVRPVSDGSYPGVVMIHENRGLRAEIRKAAEDLAKEGYLVLAVDLLGAPVETQEEARALTSKFDQTNGTANMRAAANFLRGAGATKVASWGWCFGGKQSVELAISGEQLDATVVYYGG